MNKSFPYALTRLKVVMLPNRDDPDEVEGVLNPATAFAPDGRLMIYPRVVGVGNHSSVAEGEVVIEGGVPSHVERGGIALRADRGWEHGTLHGGVEDPRITHIPKLGLYVMTYVAFGPLGPRTALAVSSDLGQWRRLGPIMFSYDDELDTDLNLFPNKDAVWFPEPIPGPDGVLCLGLIHRPMWEIKGQEPPMPKGITDERAAIWMSYVRLQDALEDAAALTRPFGHKEIAHGETDWEALKIGGGPPPIRVPEGWLLLYHGVSGTIHSDPFKPQTDVHYAAGGMILDAADPSRVLLRTAEPLLSPETDLERRGIVANVVFPTAIADIEGQLYTFYGMADDAIGVARIDRTPASA